MHSYKDDIELDFISELNADRKAQAVAETKLDNEALVKIKGIDAEDAFGSPLWQEKTDGKLVTKVVGLYVPGQNAIVEIDPEGDNLYGTSLLGAWVDPGNAEMGGYATLHGVKSFVRRYVAAKALRDSKFDLASVITPKQQTDLVNAWTEASQLDHAHKYAKSPNKRKHDLHEIADSMGITQGYDVTQP